ncbi:hypothetical protein AQJ66_09115 [Streptomyces bungoensis]|uniref:MobA/VirD2-like nuclease domain-containing protein n=1 Tax=Streptomyces bungoensis TaxID=285568 RepID=A0A117RFE4_9ACTN|nr:hypothetical protein AQJ66_09115 [Streptomyces bungoensis]
MIAKIGSGKSTAGLIRYLFDTKKAKDHTDPHLVASWDGFAPDPGRADDFDATKKQLVADLDQRVKQARRLGRAPERHVWHCSVRAAPGDRHLTDAEWADIAHRVVAATGIAPQGDPDGCRWVAVRHADDHIHIAATKVRGDLRTARHWNDYLTADKELAAIEKQAAYQQAAAEPLAALAQRQPPARTMKRHAQRIIAILPDHADQVLDDPAWPALAAALTEAETTGHHPEQLLQHAARQRTLDDARSTARTLTWRIQRLAARQAPSDPARAAQARTWGHHDRHTPARHDRARHSLGLRPPRDTGNSGTDGLASRGRQPWGYTLLPSDGRSHRAVLTRGSSKSSASSQRKRSAAPPALGRCGSQEPIRTPIPRSRSRLCW